MTRTVERIALAVALGVLCAGAASAQLPQVVDPAAAGLSDERFERLDTVLADYIDRAQLAGSVTLVARDGQTVYLQAHGMRDREANAPMQVDSMFRIASQTKAIVSVAIMMLQEQGRLLITDPVGRYLPEFMETTVAVADGAGRYDIVAADRPITLRDLLTHTSGIGYGTGTAADRWKAAGLTGWYFANRDEPIRASVARMAGLPADAQPGERWIYGYNTDILGAVVEVVSGQPLDRFLDQAVFRPLGMRDTHFYVPPGKRDRLATLYSMRNGRLMRAPDADNASGQGAYVDGPRASFSGGAGLVSTAGDYARFLQMLLQGGQLDGVRLLGPKTVELMTADHIPDVGFRPGQGFGLGFSVVKDVGARGVPGSIGEFGWGGAYHSTYWVDPVESLVVVHLTQLLPAAGVDDHDKLRTLVYQAIVD